MPSSYDSSLLVTKAYSARILFDFSLNNVYFVYQILTLLSCNFLNGQYCGIALFHSKRKRKKRGLHLPKRRDTEGVGSDCPLIA